MAGVHQTKASIFPESGSMFSNHDFFLYDARCPDGQCPGAKAQVSDSRPWERHTQHSLCGLHCGIGMPLCLCWLGAGAGWVLVLALACCCQPAPESCDAVVASGGRDVIFIKRRCAKTATRLAAAVAADAALGNAAVDRLGVADIGRWASLLFWGLASCNVVGEDNWAGQHSTPAAADGMGKGKGDGSMRWDGGWGC